MTARGCQEHHIAGDTAGSWFSKPAISLKKCWGGYCSKTLSIYMYIYIYIFFFPEYDILIGCAYNVAFHPRLVDRFLEVRGLEERGELLTTARFYRTQAPPLQRAPQHAVGHLGKLLAPSRCAVRPWNRPPPQHRPGRQHPLRLVPLPLLLDHRLQPVYSCDQASRLSLLCEVKESVGCWCARGRGGGGRGGEEGRGGRRKGEAGGGVGGKMSGGGSVCVWAGGGEGEEGGGVDGQEN